MMKLSDSFTIQASKADVWSVFMDVEKLSGCVPGCKEVKMSSPTRYEANMEVKIQFMTIQFRVTGELKEAVEGEALQVEMTGQPVALAGLFRNQLHLQLKEEEPGTTRVQYEMDLQMTGRLASLGDILMKGTVKKKAEEFATNVQTLFQSSQEIYN
ncbi:CoxG family protein [Brevibacillus porteri]|uniref:CoxG family protein n=1 Tax=Brevibacillus porteri TaxID=2126350 RepID=UPI00370AF046